MKKKTGNVATLKLKFDFIDPRLDKLQNMMRAELDDLQQRFADLELKMKGRKRGSKKTPPPFSPAQGRADLG